MNLLLQILRTSSSCPHTRIFVSWLEQLHLLQTPICRGLGALCLMGTRAGAQLQNTPYGVHQRSRFPLSGSYLDSRLSSKTPPGCSSGTVLAGLGAAEDFNGPANGIHAYLMPFPAPHAAPSVSRWPCQNPPTLRPGYDHPCLPTAEQAAALPLPCWLGKAPLAIAQRLNSGCK